MSLLPVSEPHSGGPSESRTRLREPHSSGCPPSSARCPSYNGLPPRRTLVDSAHIGAGKITRAYQAHCRPRCLRDCIHSEIFFADVVLTVRPNTGASLAARAPTEAALAVWAFGHGLRLHVYRFRDADRLFHKYAWRGLPRGLSSVGLSPRRYDLGYDPHHTVRGWHFSLRVARRSTAGDAAEPLSAQTRFSPRLMHRCVAGITKLSVLAMEFSSLSGTTAGTLKSWLGELLTSGLTRMPQPSLTASPNLAQAQSQLRSASATRLASGASVRVDIYLVHTRTGCTSRSTALAARFLRNWDCSTRWQRERSRSGIT